MISLLKLVPEFPPLDLFAQISHDLAPRGLKSMIASRRVNSRARHDQMDVSAEGWRPVRQSFQHELGLVDLQEAVKPLDILLHSGAQAGAALDAANSDLDSHGCVL